MSMKTCQLCGRPLGRLRFADDFCSREHRNQFRLRQGMDRLLEANKLANVMRRRETLRQITPEKLLCSGNPQLRSSSSSAFRIVSKPRIRYASRTVRFHRPDAARMARFLNAWRPALSRLETPDAGRGGEFAVVAPRRPSYRRQTDIPEPNLRVTAKPLEKRALPLRIDSAPRSLALAIPAPALSLPRSQPLPPAGENLDRLLPVSLPRRTVHPPAQREVLWQTALTASRGHLASTGPELAGLDTNHPVRVSIKPAEDAFTYRLTAIPFTPSNAAVKPSGSVRVAPLDPAVEPENTPATIEEHFTDGLSRWIGDTTQWRVGAAGVRPAGLALLEPSVTMGDYEVEFLTRIESGCLNFVFRAANFSNYHKAAIRRLESGALELKRSVVIGGLEEHAAAVPMGTPARANTAFTIKARIRRNDFTIFIEGEPVVRFTDGRLPVGGVGFAAAEGARVRVYFVRVIPVIARAKVSPIRMPGRFE